ncbi:MAG: GNAT family N-acetyltransferase [Methanobacteriota archaeon]|nr:MAG: GNAT family N-acetyltransferase [Euryarchaeota archaeon]
MRSEVVTEIKVNGPEIEGLRFRAFADDSDFGKMSKINQLSLKADGVVWIESEEDIRARFSAVKDRDPRSDILFVDVHDTTVGYAQLSWDDEPSKVKAYIHSAFLLPEWRGRGIREALFHFNERRLEEIASQHGFECDKYLQVWSYDEPNDWKSVVEKMGYTPVWHLLEMAHVNLPRVSISDLPEGLCVRPPREEEYHDLWQLYRDCFIGELWFVPYTWSEDAYRNWVSSSTFDPELINVAWDGANPVGIVEMVVSEEEIQRTGDKVAHAWAVCVAERWRRKGVARALLTRGLTQVRDLGIEEVLLDTEAENKHSAMRVYESVGFDIRRTFTFHRKAIRSK